MTAHLDFLGRVGLEARVLTPDLIKKGALRRGIRVLILPQVIALSEREAAQVRDPRFAGKVANPREGCSDRQERVEGSRNRSRMTTCSSDLPRPIFDATVDRCAPHCRGTACVALQAAGAPPRRESQRRSLRTRHTACRLGSCWRTCTAPRRRWQSCRG